MEQEIAGVHLHDALVDVVEQAKAATSDFELYDLQKQLYEFGGDVSSLAKAKEAWALDSTRISIWPRRLGNYDPTAHGISSSTPTHTLSGRAFSPESNALTQPNIYISAGQSTLESCLRTAAPAICFPTRQCVD